MISRKQLICCVILKDKRVNGVRETNSLTIHTGKSEAMIITRQDFISPLRPVMSGNEIIKYVRKATSLRIEIDNHLRWESQVKKVTESFSAKVDQLRRTSYLSIKVKEP